MKSREIKFRVWRFCHNENKFKFYYTQTPQLLDFGGADIIFYTGKLTPSFTDGRTSFPNEGEAIHQFTGLVDKNGREIFEGDILNYPIEHIQYPVICKWDFVRGCWVFRIRDDKTSFHYYHYEFNGQSEIIGNIFENPELIN